MLSLSEYQQRASAWILGSSVDGLLQMNPTAALIHRDTIFNTWMRTLRLTFPSVSACGTTGFERLAREFVRTYPSQHPCLHEYGNRFPAFLEAHASALLADAARFDLALERAAQRSTEHRLSFEIAPHVELRLNPSLTCLDTRHPVDLIRDAVEAGAQDPLAGLDIGLRSCRFAVWRGVGGPMVKRLSACAANFLEALLAGDSAADAVGVCASGRTQTIELLHVIRSEILTASFAELVRLPCEIRC